MQGNSVRLFYAFMKRITKTYANKIWLTETTIADAIANNWERSLVILINLKKAYKKPIFYNFSYRSISKKTGIPTTTLQRHIKKLIQKGLLEIHSNNLCVLGSNKVKRSLKSPLIPIEYNSNRQLQLINIQFTRILKNFRQQSYMGALKADIIKLQKDDRYLKLEDVKRTYANSKKYISTKNEKLNQSYVMSNIKFANSINRKSKHTGIRLQRKLNQLGLIKSKKNIVKVYDKKIDKRAFFEMNFKYNCFLGNDGIVRQRLANVIIPCN